MPDVKHPILNLSWSKASAGSSAAYGTPSLARLAYNRLGFGPRPSDPDFGNDWNAFVAYVDAQLNYTSIDDSACDALVNKLDRHDYGGLLMPPLDAGPAAIEAYRQLAEQNNVYAPYTLFYYLGDATYARAVFSRRQLFQVMVDFWTNHFNTLPVNSYKAWEDYYVMRRYALGNFRDLLGADAQSPVMLQYLSNTYNDGGNPNENYAREIMELHTLGSINRIPGHAWYGKPNYTEEDVHNVALIFSGWTTFNSAYGEFRFNDTPSYPIHDVGKKHLKLDHLNYTYNFKKGGIQQGEKLLDILARHPSTAYRIARKLCQRFISDNPETFCPGAINAGMNAFLTTQGNLAATVRALLLYQAPGADFASSWGQKVKRPFEFFVGAMRALNVSTYPPPFSGTDTWEWHTFSQYLGQELFSCPPPTGYPDVIPVWWNSNQLFGRWELANTLVQRCFDAQYDDQPPTNNALDLWIGNNGAPPTAAAVVSRLIKFCIGYAIDPADESNFANYLGGGVATTPITSANPRLRPLIAVLLASSYSQWR
ncbi:MAG: DUF1800 domain-containing protein [Caldilineaceae bacterium]